MKTVLKWLRTIRGPTERESEREYGALYIMHHYASDCISGHMYLASNLLQGGICL